MVGVADGVGVGVSVTSNTVGASIGEITVVGVAVGAPGCSPTITGCTTTTVGVVASPTLLGVVASPTTAGVVASSKGGGVGVPGVGVGVTVWVGVSGMGMTERGSTPGGMTITPGVEPLGGVTTTIP
jgi:hypothetical protein